MKSTEIGVARVARAVTYFVYAFVIVALVILTLGFFLLLFGANADAPFAEWVYRSLDRVMAPFRGIFKPVPVNGDSVLDTSVLFAMIIYAIVGLALSALIDWLSSTIGRLRAREWAETQAQSYAPARGQAHSPTPPPTG
jgi:uncharacterized protein YggT (Ycf19 family)